MRKTLKRAYVMNHIISQIPPGDCCRYDPKRKIFSAITEFEATTRIVQKLRDYRRKRDAEAVPFRNYAFYPGTTIRLLRVCARRDDVLIVKCSTCD
jgi:hypothetical protein